MSNRPDYDGFPLLVICSVELGYHLFKLLRILLYYILLFLSIYLSSFFSSIVEAGDEFECLAVLNKHTQDVKNVLWHPEKEVIHLSVYFYIRYKYKLYPFIFYFLPPLTIPSLLFHITTIGALLLQLR